ncbi:MAG TPA: MotA/TolQ/ExbB proton channel family protein [Candidatus Hydrogenedens sp.]|nr:MotA/TolQ/ExbB proton channel family protein [Candidatus Hydrogenedens sp.]
MNWMNMIYQGGWVMFPLGICSVIALAIILERFFALRMKKNIPENLTQLLSYPNMLKDLETIRSVSQRNVSPLGILVNEIINLRSEPKDVLVEHINTLGRTQITYLERGLTVLQIISVISPLLGLLGTVLGMVDIFNVITVGGIGNAQMLAQGISKALITTVVGLIIAIPSLVAYHLYLRRVEEIGIKIQELIMPFLMKVKSIDK